MADQDSPPKGGIVQLVSPIQSVNEQLGGHLAGALQHPGTVAVVSTIMPGVGPEKIVSVPLNPQQFHAIQGLLQQMMAPEALSPAARRAVGFRGDEE
jgi:hypothetical protein